jgi:hypothetical protein
VGVEVDEPPPPPHAARKLTLNKRGKNFAMKMRLISGFLILWYLVFHAREN